MSDYRSRCLSEKGRSCVICSESEKVVVHHIDGDRSNNDIENLVPLCTSCHRRVHAGSEGYEDWTEKLPRSALSAKKLKRPEVAFPFSEAVQRPVYVREESLHQFEDALDFEVRRALRDAGERDVPKRELHDAALRVAADHTDEVAEALIEARRNR